MTDRVMNDKSEGSRLTKLEQLVLEQKLHRAAEKVSAYLAQYGCQLPSPSIVFDPQLSEDTLASHRYPGTVVARETSLPESVIAHELVHIAQKTLEQSRGCRLLYALLAEGLAEWVTRMLYREHNVKYRAGYQLIELLVSGDKSAIGDLLRLNDMALAPEHVKAILANRRLAEYSRSLLGTMAGQIRDGLRASDEAGLSDPTFVSLGEEVRAWKFLLDGRFEGAKEEVDEVVGEWFKEGKVD